MKKIIIWILIIASLLVFAACSAAPDGGNQGGQGNFGDVTGSKLTTSGLNNLREVVGDDWGYAFVARDCIFNEYGYYKFDDVLEYNLSEGGVILGDEDDRELYFTRDEEAVYGVYVSGKTETANKCYAFSADYKTASVKFNHLGNFAAEDEIYVGQGGSESCAIILIGKTLIAYDYKNRIKLAEENIGLNYSYPNEGFEFYQKGKSAVFFTPSEEYKTHVYTFDGLNAFSLVKSKKDFSAAEFPAAVGGCYLFGQGEDELLPVDGGEVLGSAQLAAVKEEYEEYLRYVSKGAVSDGVYEAIATEDSLTVKRIEDGEERTVPVSVIYSLTDISAIIAARDNSLPLISSVKLFGGEIFVVLELAPTVLEAFRDVNDGIPPVVVRYDFDTREFAFCGLVDFTGYSIYRIVSL